MLSENTLKAKPVKLDAKTAELFSSTSLQRVADSLAKLYPLEVPDEVIDKCVHSLADWTKANSKTRKWHKTLVREYKKRLKQELPTARQRRQHQSLLN